MAAAHAVDSVVIRAGDFFGGPGSGSWLDLAMATRLKAGRFVYPGPPHLAHAWAYLPDLPGCTTTADSPEQVERQLPEAVELYLSYYTDRGLPPPSPQARVGTLRAA